ncbi:MAG: UPF0175 family protein [Chloroflexi bacterium]|nr:UPF0175 family protein [Chloroflexota bacterium]
MNVTLDLPEDVVRLLGATSEAARRRATESVVADLVRTGQISQSKTARILSLSRHDLLDFLAAHDLPSGPASAEELHREVRVAQRFIAGGRQ